jgi:hypothetical protein
MDRKASSEENASVGIQMSFYIVVAYAVISRYHLKVNPLFYNIEPFDEAIFTSSKSNSSSVSIKMISGWTCS